MASPSDNSSLSTSNEQENEESQTRSNDIDDEQAVLDKLSDINQRIAWNKLHVAIGYLIYKVNAVNIGIVKKELLQQNMIRGNEMFCTFIIQAQQSSITDTRVYASLVATINPVLPEVGDLILKRCIMQFSSAYFKNETSDCLASVMFIGHLINLRVASRRLAIQLLWVFIEKQDILSAKAALLILELCGKKISQVYRNILQKTFDFMRNLLNNQQLDKEVKENLKLMFKLQKNGFKFQHLDLFPINKSQITHYTSINFITTAPNITGYRYEPEFELEENIYKDSILRSQGYDSEEESESESETDYDDQYDGEKKLLEAMAYIYGINKDTDVSLRKICLRSMINTTYVAADYSNLAYQIVKHYHGHINVDLCFMILDCCCEHTFYINHFGLLTKELCQINEKFVDIVEITFIHCYIESDSFDSHKSNIIAIYFAHLSRLNLIPFKLTAILGKKSIYPNTSYFKIFKNLTYI